MKEVTSIYITSWHQYNGGGGRGGWFALEDLTEENYINELKKIGLDPEGRDEELVIHDYDDYELDGILYQLFGEAHPLTVIKFYKKWDDLLDDEKMAFIGLAKTDSNQTALEALEEGALDCYLVYDEEGFNDYVEEGLSCSVDPKTWEYLSRYIDWDYVRRDFSFDWSSFDFENETYYIREN